MRKFYAIFLLLLLVVGGGMVIGGLIPIIKAPAIKVEGLPAPSNLTLGESTSSADIKKIEAVVEKVVDGDTIYVKLNQQSYSVRLIGVNTPETVDPRRGVECFGKEASDEAKKLLTGKRVILEKDISETDKYDRLLRYVYLVLDDQSWLFVNDYLVRQGFAQAMSYPPDVKYSLKFLEAEREARENNRGLWGKCKIDI